MNDKLIKNYIDTAKREIYDAYRIELQSNERRLNARIAKLEHKIDALNEQYTNDMQILQNHIDHLQDIIDNSNSLNELDDIVSSIVEKHKQKFIKSKIKPNPDTQKMINDVWNALINDESI